MCAPYWNEMLSRGGGEEIWIYWYKKGIDVSRLGYLPLHAICRQLMHTQANGRAVMKLWLMKHFLTAKFTHPHKVMPTPPPAPHTHTEIHTSHQSGAHLLKVVLWQKWHSETSERPVSFEIFEYSQSLENKAPWLQVAHLASHYCRVLYRMPPSSVKRIVPRIGTSRAWQNASLHHTAL